MGRYKTITGQFKDLILGKYGQVPGEISKELVAMCTKNGEKQITCRPADLMEDEMQSLTETVQKMGYYQKEEDVLSYALFPEVATNYFKWRKANQIGIDTDMASNPQKVYPV
jgi:oxaloacetate decarboxylase alpha subunit